jgi:4-hydroxybutyrate dehydrogenase/sulfolactaldehyde 3-reductase
MEAAKGKKLPMMMGAAAKEALTIATTGLGMGEKDFSGLLHAQCKLGGLTPPKLKG